MRDEAHEQGANPRMTLRTLTFICAVPENLCHALPNSTQYQSAPRA